MSPGDTLSALSKIIYYLATDLKPGVISDSGQNLEKQF